MQDKLIEAAKHVVDNAGIHSLSGCYVIPLTALENLKAAVRAHDAGTDVCLHTRPRFMCATGWKCSECGDVKPFVKGDVAPPASHAASTAPDAGENAEHYVAQSCGCVGKCTGHARRREFEPPSAPTMRGTDERLRKAAHNLAVALEQCEKPINRAFRLAQIHGMDYTEGGRWS